MFHSKGLSDILQGLSPQAHALRRHSALLLGSSRSDMDGASLSDRPLTLKLLAESNIAE